jgi:chromosome segregation ATPase
VDVERTINFILDSQAKAEIRQAQADERQAKADERQAKADERLAKADERQAKAETRLSATEKRLDKRMDAIAKLIQQGMRMLVTQKAEFDRKINALVDAQMRGEARMERLDERMEELAAAQKDTQKTLKAFIASLQKGRNGH